MNIDLHVINTYIEHGEFPKEDEDIYSYTGGKRDVARNRQEVCIALCDELNMYCNAFPIWNIDVYQMLFADQLHTVQSITILPIFGANEKFDCEVCVYKGNYVLMIDLLNIADYTTILEQMKYILHNQIHLKLTIHVLTQMYPKPTLFKELLMHHYFVYGCSHFLSWKNQLENLFHNQEYSDKKIINTYLYTKALQVVNPTQQSKLLSSFDSSDIWLDFSSCAGMFMFASTYNEGKEKALYDVFIQGPYKL